MEQREVTMGTPRPVQRLSPRGRLRLDLAMQLYPAIARNGHGHEKDVATALEVAGMMLDQAEALEERGMERTDADDEQQQ